MFALIGGKANKEIIGNKIEKELVKLTNKEKPTILYCPYAAKDIEKSNLKFKALIRDINVDIIFLSFKNINQFEQLLQKSDILYIGGGISDDLVKIFKEYKLDIILKRHLDDNIIFAGSSAGAMLYTLRSMGDKYMFSDNYHNYNYKMVDCLNFLNITICPHYQNEDLICYNDEIKNYNLVSFGIEEDSAIVIDGKMFYSIKEESTSMAFYFNNKDYKMTYLKEKKIYEEDFCIRS
jgi:dipeptidase E